MFKYYTRSYLTKPIKFSNKSIKISTQVQNDFYLIKVEKQYG